ncbi:MAG TPA: ABC transporter ATP-binding protein [Symbiobacteriaceae bacterium]|nr:ABC transporter ATP-binding protein [Symbiobacteriaceae bacterium]
MLRLSGVYKTLQSGDRMLEILKPTDLHVPKGQALAIMGPSGSGKSTLLGLIAGLDNPSGGSIKVEGEEITGLNEDALALLRGRKIGIVFQSFNLIPNLTARENIALPMELSDQFTGDPTERSQELLEAVGLSERGHHYPVQLSGGEQQRVALARAFAPRPAMLLADEPTGNLDSATGHHIIDLLLKLNREQGTTLVMVTHDPGLAARADRIVHLRDGRIVKDEMVAQAVGGGRRP